MGHAGERLRRSALFRYGLAFVSVGTALVLSIIFLHLDSPLPFTAFAVSAIAVTFWYGDVKPGILAALLSTLTRSYFFRLEVPVFSRMLYDSAFLVFALLMIWATRARDELEVRVAERTAELTRANEDLKLEIAERKRAEEAVKRAEQQTRQASEQHRKETRALIDAIPQQIWSGPADGSIDFGNERWRSYMGLSHEELQGQGWQSMLHPDDRERVLDAWHKAVADGTSYEQEERHRGADGDYRWFLSRGVPMRDAEGRIVRWYGTNTDIEDRKLAEEAVKQAEDQTRQAQKMEAIAQFAGGITHDFNNLLLIILGQCQFVLKKTEPGDSRYARLQEIQRAAERAKWLTAQLMIFARRGKLELQVIDLNSALKELRELLERLMGEDIVLVTELSPTLGHVQSDRGLIQQVIMNLAANARDAMPGGGILKIATEDVEISETSAAQDRDVPAGRYVVLTVTDSGTGIDAATQARLFEPFFTTKEASKGTGLGLAVVRSIVAQSGGHVTVQSEVGRGSTFKVFLPVVEQAEHAQPAKKMEEVSPRGSETVLLVEDARSVRIVIRDYLVSGGYFVLEAETPGQALEFAQKHQGPIHLLLTDMIMPSIGGVQLARQIRSLRPDIKVLYMSGYAPRAAGSEGSEEGASFLQKPFMSEDLLRSVRRALDKAKS